jgi:hypothetical protein
MAKMTTLTVDEPRGRKKEMIGVGIRTPSISPSLSPSDIRTPKMSPEPRRKIKKDPNFVLRLSPSTSPSPRASPRSSPPRSSPPAPSVFPSTSSKAKKVVSREEDKCKEFFQITESLSDGDVFKNPFSGKKIQKGKPAYKKIMKECQKYKVEQVSLPSKKQSQEEIDLDDLFAD